MKDLIIAVTISAILGTHFYDMQVIFFYDEEPPKAGPLHVLTPVGINLGPEQSSTPITWTK
jgi:hypothetical protein